MSMRTKIFYISILISFVSISQNNTIYYSSLNIDTLINVYKLLKTDSELTIYRIQLFSSESPEKIEQIKEKTREELRNALVKENILNKEDAILLNEFIKKLQKEINQK